MSIARALMVARILLAVAVSALAFAAIARADGDPGSDVLLAQNLFTASDSGISVSQQQQLGRLLDATSKAEAPIRVAIISHSDDLGTDTPLWEHPQGYAAFLGTELSLTYPGRLLVVMPGGVGFYWSAKLHDVQRIANALASIAPGSSSPAALIAATRVAVRRIEAATAVGTGTGTHAITPASTPASTSVPVNGPALEPLGTGTDRTLLLLALLAIVGAIALAAMPWIRRRPLHPKGALASAPLALAAVVLVALSQGASTPVAQSGTLQNNPNLDPGSAPQLPALRSSAEGSPAAPNFTLTDETGRTVSLSQYRGKVVILSFIDAECQTICPLTSAAMLDARRSLGAAGRDVQLLAVNANWKSTQVDDVLNYTDLHGMRGQWHFLTGSLSQLKRTWSDYGVNELAFSGKTQLHSSQIDHVVATFVIDRQGRLRTGYQTQASYAAIPQLGQLLAQAASRLLPSHPRVETHYSYGQITGVSPTQAVSVPRLGGGRMALGPGRPHLYLFFATWDRQTTSIAAELELLDGYQRDARRSGLPPVTAVDEASVEPSAAALPDFISSLARPLSYPVALDETGRIADGYDVQGEPWFVLTSASGAKRWFREIYTSGWPTLKQLETDVRAGLAHVATGPIGERATTAELRRSPPPLAKLHAQASRVLGGGQRGLDARIRALRGHPIVVNVWGSWCEPCQSEFGRFARASAQYGTKVAFLGSDTNEASPSDGQQFLDQHYVSYPSYETTPQSMQSLLPGGLQDTPTTIFYSAAGRLTHITLGPYESQGTLDQDVEQYALDSR